MKRCRPNIAPRGLLSSEHPEANGGTPVHQQVTEDHKGSLACRCEEVVTACICDSWNERNAIESRHADTVDDWIEAHRPIHTTARYMLGSYQVAPDAAFDDFLLEVMCEMEPLALFVTPDLFVRYPAFATKLDRNRPARTSIIVLGA